jgi:hypothetical protein
MSMLDQLDAYESPHKLPMYPMSGGNLDAHHRWYQAREYYAVCGNNGGDQADIEESRAYWFNEMLKAVTETNPPVNRIDLNASPAATPERARAPRSTSAMAFIFITLYMLVVATWISAVMWVIT